MSLVEEEEKEEETVEEEESLKKFALKALAAKRKTAFDVLVSQHLTVSTPMGDPMQKLRLICEAAFLTGGKANVDMQEIAKIYRLCLAFLNAEKGSSVPWGFSPTPENYTLYIKPWHSEDVPLAFAYASRHEKDEKDMELMKCKSPDERFFLLTNSLNLSHLSLQQLKVEFLAWAMPIIMKAAAEIAKLLDPETLKSLLTGKPQAENVEEQQL